MLDRRSALKLLGASAAIAIGCPAIARNQPLRLGILAAKAGTAAYIGSNGLRAVEWAAQRINEGGGIAGRKVELVVDEETNPKDTLDRARRLALQEKVDAIHGVYSTGVSVAIAPALEEMRVLTQFWDGTTQDGVRETMPNPKYVFRSTDNECEAVMASLLAVKKWKGQFRRIAAISPDYSYGRNIWAAFQAIMEKFGIPVQVVGEHWTKFGQLEFTANVAALKSSKPDLIYCVLGNADLPIFMRAAHDAGLTEIAKFMLPQAGHEWGQLKKPFMPEGSLICANTFYFDLATQPQATSLQRDFVHYYRDRYQDLPHWECDRSYFCIQLYKAGFEKAYLSAGRWPEAEDVARAMEGLEIESLGGHARMRADHIPDQTFHQGFSTNDNNYDVPTMRRIYSAFSDQLQKPPGAEFWSWLADAKFPLLNGTGKD
jgi:branched-chain amino acid transport system substrate-binding protein